MKTLFLFIPHYVFSSDLLRTNYIKYLATKYKVVVFSPIFKTTSAQDYYQSSNITYVTWDTPRPNFWIFFNKTLRVAMVREFDNLEYHKLRAKTGINLNWQRKLLQFISRLLPKKITRADFFSKIERFLLPNSQKFRSYLKIHRPAIILTATPGFSEVEAEVIALAKKNKIITVAINFNWDNLFNNAKHIRKTDYLITWNSRAKKAAQEIHGYAANHVFIGGPLRFDHNFNHNTLFKNENERISFLKSKKLNPTLKTILFTTVPPHTYPFQIEFLKELISLRDQNIFGQNLNIYVRTHPRDETVYYQNLIQGKKNIHLESAGTTKNQQRGQLNRIEMSKKDLQNLHLTLLYADLAINFRSTITLETFMYDLPTINLAYHNYILYYQMDHYLPILKEKAVKLVKNTEEFITAMRVYLKNPKLDSEKRQKILNQEIPFRDGLSYKRNVDFLEEILNQINYRQ